MGQVHFEEFLYRGRPKDDARGPAWHVVLMENTGPSEIHGRPQWQHHTLNMAQAQAAGWPLPAILSAINVDMLKELETLRTKISTLETEIGRLTAKPASV